MNWGKLKRTIERDFKRNPAKTGALLALLPIAAYFIGPLLWKMLPKKSTGVAAAGTVMLAPAGSNAIPNATGASPAGAPRWSDVADQIARDSRMASAASVGLRNPFRGLQPTIDLAQQNKQPVETTPEEPDTRTPEDFGLQLTATIVGDRVKLATINGKQYRENARLPILNLEGGRSAENGGTAFVVRRVAKKYVTLEREGKLYELPLSK